MTANIILAIKSYTKNIVKNILLTCTINTDIAMYKPKFRFSFLSKLFIFGLNIKIMATNSSEVIKKNSNPFIPKPISVPSAIAIYKIPAGILLLHAAANMASPNGANS